MMVSFGGGNFGETVDNWVFPGVIRASLFGLVIWVSLVFRVCVDDLCHLLSTYL